MRIIVSIASGTDRGTRSVIVVAAAATAAKQRAEHPHNIFKTYAEKQMKSSFLESLLFHFSLSPGSFVSFIFPHTVEA